MVRRHVDPSSDSARRKERCLIRMLDDQLDICDRTEKAIHEMTEAYPAHTLPSFPVPGLQKDATGNRA